MKVTTVRYKVAPEKIAENIRLVRGVFAQLQKETPNGLQYASMHDEDGSFMHIVRQDDEAADDVLTSLSAFDAFRSGIRDRLIEGPVSVEFDVVGTYQLF